MPDDSIVSSGSLRWEEKEDEKVNSSSSALALPSRACHLLRHEEPSQARRRPIHAFNTRKGGYAEIRSHRFPCVVYTVLWETVGVSGSFRNSIPKEQARMETE